MCYTKKEITSDGDTAVKKTKLWALVVFLHFLLCAPICCESVRDKVGSGWCLGGTVLSALHVCHAQKGKHGHFGVGITRFKEGVYVLRGGGDKISLCPLCVQWRHEFTQHIRLW